METSNHPAEIFYIPLILVNVIVKVQEDDIFFSFFLNDIVESANEFLVVRTTSAPLPPRA